MHPVNGGGALPSRTDRHSGALNPAQLVCDQDEDEQRHRKSDPQRQGANGVVSAAFVSDQKHHGRPQARNDQHKRDHDDDFQDRAPPIEAGDCRRMESPRLKRKGIAPLPSIAALVLVALTVSLGNWQTRRAEEKIALQAERDQAAARAPVVLDERALAAPNSLLGRRVIADGRFLERYSVFIDNRSYRGQAGFHVLTPFRLEGLPQTILVLRGWVPQDPAARGRLPALVTPAAQVRIEALAQRDLDQVLELMKAAPPGPEDRLWQNASIAAMSQWSGLTLLPIVLRQTAEAPVPPDVAPGRSVSSSASPTSPQTSQVVPSASPAPSALTLVRDWPSPGAGVDKHRAYAFQWYSMAVLVTCLWFIFFWRSRQPRS